jgi:glucose/arabinose dehydrogenase
MTQRAALAVTWPRAAVALLVVALLGGAPAFGWRTASAQQPASAVGLTPVLGGFSSPLFVTHDGVHPNRLYVVEKGGLVRLVVDGQVQAAPFLDARALVTAGGAEQGLLGLAFHPEYAANGLFYVAYTASGDGANTVARYRVSSTDASQADPDSRLVLLAIPDFADNHNGGVLAFGPDGYLYVGTGDGGGGGDLLNNAQNLASLLGKVLRLDVRAADPYAIPPTNPFVHTAGARGEIWALGTRNPWRFSFDRGTGDLYLADVGQFAWEEVNVQAAGSAGGQNYQWRCFEGFHVFNAATDCSQGISTPPILEYDHSGGNCSITGGYVYRGPAFPSLHGLYFYGDYCSGRIWTAHRLAGGTWVQTPRLDTTYRISSFGEDLAGELYLTDIAGGGVYRVVDASVPNPCVVNTLATLPDAPIGSAAAQPGAAPVAGAAGRARLDPASFRRLRDRVLDRSPGGQRYVRLYEAHSPEVVRLMLADPQLLAALRDGLLVWQADLGLLADGRGAEATISAEEVRAAEAVLDRLAAKGSPALRQAIARERRAHPPKRLVGMSFDRALAALTR